MTRKPIDYTELARDAAAREPSMNDGQAHAIANGVIGVDPAEVARGLYLLNDAFLDRLAKQVRAERARRAARKVIRRIDGRWCEVQPNG